MKGCWSRPGRTCSFRCAARIGGTDLGQLREAVEQEFLTWTSSEQSVRSVMAKLETGFLRRFASFQHD